MADTVGAEVGRWAKNIRALDVKTVRISVAVAALLVALIVLAANALGGGDSPSGAASEEVRVLDHNGLAAAVADLDNPVYWLGARPGTENYRLRTSDDGDANIEYLPGGAGAGSPSAEAVTVGTYPLPEAALALRRAEAPAEGLTVSVGDGYEVLSGLDSDSAYVVLESEPDLQVEVYSPKQGEAVELVGSGALTAVP